MGIEEAMRAVLADDFDPEAASATDTFVYRLLAWGETVGTLAKNGLIDTDLVLDWIWVAGLWEKVGPAARKQRDKTGVPGLYEISRRSPQSKTAEPGIRPAKRPRRGAPSVCRHD